MFTGLIQKVNNSALSRWIKNLCVERSVVKQEDEDDVLITTFFPTFERIEYDTKCIKHLESDFSFDDEDDDSQIFERLDYDTKSIKTYPENVYQCIYQASNSIDNAKCKKVSFQDGLTTLNKDLQMLTITNCKKMTSVPHVVSDFTDLQVLHLEFCDELIDVTALRHLKKLHTLIINWTPKLTDVSVIGEFEGLKMLGITVCRSLVDISPLANLKEMNVLYIPYGNNINLTPLAKLENLIVKVENKENL